MTEWYLYLAAAILGYLMGNIQFAVIFSRLFHKDDVRRYGSGNAGSTNMMRVYGIKAGILTFCGDLTKGMAGALIGNALAGRCGAYLGAAGVVLGHCFPVFFGFRGGKGVASALGAILAIDPLWTLGVIGVAAISAAITRTVSVASLAGTTAYLIFALALGRDIWAKLFAALIFAVIILRHRDNISRLIHGREDKNLPEFNSKK